MQKMAFDPVKESGWDTITESPFGIGGPKNMDSNLVKILHDAFKKTIERLGMAAK